jgi:alpha-beta hydrolase superfamily lysophospholipase
MTAATSPDAATTSSAADAANSASDGRVERFYLTASDGTRLHCRRWSPPPGEVRATLLFLHGIASHGGWFAETAALLAERGIAVYAPDRRGSGMSFGPRGHIPVYERAVADAELFLDRAIREQLGPPLFLAGSSWAAKVALAVAVRRQHDLDGLILHGPGLFPRIDLPVTQKLRVLLGYLFGPSRRLPIPLQPELYTRNPSAIAYIADDRLRLLTASARFFWETHRLDRARDQLAAQLDLPVLVQIGAADRIADADATAAWVDRLRTPDRARYVYAGASHTLDFEPEPLVSVYRADLLRWLDAHIGDGSAWETYHAC